MIVLYWTAYTVYSEVSVILIWADSKERSEVLCVILTYLIWALLARLLQCDEGCTEGVTPFSDGSQQLSLLRA